jgi:basic membrane protein A
VRKRWLTLAVLVIVTVLLASAVAAVRGSAASAAHKASFSACLVTDIGGLNDKSFNHLAYVGLQRAEKAGVKGRVITSKSANDYIPNLQTCAQSGAGITIGVGFLMTDAMDAVATSFPKSKFAIVDVDVSTLKHKPKNVEGLLFREQQAGYLVGYAAGLWTKQKGGAAVGSVGGIKIPPVDRYIAGYQAGAKAADPNIKTLNGYSNSFTDQSKCKGLAQTQIGAGSDVVFQVAGGCGLGALDAAAQKGVWGIGVDNDQKAVGPKVLASAVKKVDQAVFLTIKDLKNGVYHGGTDKIFGLAQNGVDLVSIRPVVPASIIAKVNAAKAKIKAGTITPPDTVK